MFSIGKDGYTIVHTNEGPNIGKRSCMTGGETFEDAVTLVEKFDVNGKSLAESIDSILVTEWT